MTTDWSSHGGAVEADRLKPLLTHKWHDRRSGRITSKRTTMTFLFVSLGLGVLVGASYALLNVRSHAPPIVVLLALLGMLIGEQIVAMARWLLGRLRLVRTVSSGPVSSNPRRPSGLPGAEP
jgi:XapX domain-containing protein